MHKFLRTIGFSDIRKRDLEMITKDVIDHPDVLKVTKDSEGNEFAELSKEIAPNMGITVRGTYQDDDRFQMEYYYPFFIGTGVSTQEQIDVEKHSEKESYAGVCDELRLGVTLIFYLQNVADYLAEKNGKLSMNNMHGAVLAGLSCEGKILFPIEKVENKDSKSSSHKSGERNQLIAEAREGNEDAIESLTLEDMDMYSILSKRIAHEDILTIVNSYFMPYGIESDQYSILAEIIDYSLEKNSLTGEEIYCMKVDCNDLVFDICINKKDLMGKPAVGRRFKGNIWMQGSVCL